MSIHKYKTKKGILYYVSFYIGLNAYGKKKRHLKRGFKTKKEAKLYEARLEAGVVAPTINSDNLIPKSLITNFIKNALRHMLVPLKKQLLPKLKISIEYMFYQYLERSLLIKSVL